MSLNSLLDRYVNGGSFSRVVSLAGLAVPTAPFALNAGRVVRAVAADRADAVLIQPRTEAQHVKVPPYAGQNPHVLRMREYLRRHLTPDLVSAYVHGSLATGEEIAYSDFDALVILHDPVFSNPRLLARVARLLDRARAIMLDCDPLQHHGWFVMAEHQLALHPEHYFPVELFRHAAALLPEHGNTLSIRPYYEPTRMREAFDRMSRAVLRRLDAHDYPTNVYDLKVLLSQIMLLPTLYVQARDQRGVFKKHSFALAKPDVAPELWSAMDEVSRIRAQWAVVIRPTRRRLLRVRTPLARRVLRQYAPAIPRDLMSMADADLYEGVRQLTLALRASLSGHFGGR